MTTPGNNEQVRYDILIDAKSALAALQELLRTTDDNAQKVKIFSNVVLEQSKAMGVAWKDLLSTYKQLNAELSQQHKANLFGPTGGQDLIGQSQQYIQSLEDTGRTTQQVAQQTNAMGDVAENTTNRMVRGIDAVRVAMGAIVAMIVFNVIQGFQQLFGMAMTGLREMEVHLYNLAGAERVLSEQGIGIKPEDLQAIIDKIRELDPLLSKYQATELVSRISRNVAPALGFNKEQIDQLAQSVVVFTIKNKALGYSFEEVEKQMTDAFTTGKVSTGINKLGIKLNDAIVKEKALSDAISQGVVANEKQFDSLDAKTQTHLKSAAMLKLLYADASKEVSHLPEYFKTADAAFGIIQRSISDFMTQMGQKFGPVIRDLFLGLAKIIDRIAQYFEKNASAVNAFVVLLDGAVKIGLALLTVFERLWELLGKIATSPFVATLGKIVDKVYNKLTGNQPSTDTPTAPVSSFGATSPEVAAQENKAKAIADAESKIQDIMRESADKKADIEREYGDKLQDIATNYSQKLEDIARETAQKRADALTDYNQKVDDINRDSAQKIADAQREWRQKEIDRQKEFQNRMRELRDKFLMDLEDALHERDARQVLRLIRQYALDKKNLEEKAKLDRQQAKKDLQAKLQDIEIERQRKLEAAQREYQDKLQQIAIGEARARSEAQIWQQRALADANLWHQRQLQEQQQYLQRKLRDLANAIMQEYNLTAQGAQAVYSMLNGYFGAGGMATNLLSGFNASLGGGGTSSGPGTQVGASPGIGSGLYNPYDVRTPRQPYFGYAEGGSLVATRPTKAMFGENGPELVSFTPLERPGNNVNKVFGDKSALGMGGDLKVRLELSPDLEARIIDSSMDGVAVTIEKILRSK